MDAFSDSAPTEKFLLIMDRLFDVLNSHSNSQKGYKQALSLNNIGRVSKFLFRCVSFLLSLERNDGVRLADDHRKVGIIGLVCSIQSLLYIADHHLKSSRDTLAAYRFSQDHIELLFNAIRRAGGWNNNPSCSQFGYIYRRLLARAEVTPSSNGNVTVQDGSELEETSEPITDVLESDTLADEGALIGSTLLRNATVYIAGWLVRKLMASLKCQECHEVLVTRPSGRFQREHHLLHLKNNGGLLIPSDGVVVVASAVEKCLNDGDPKMLL